MALDGGVLHRGSVRTTSRPFRVRRLRVAGLLVLLAATIAILGNKFLASPFTTTTSRITVPQSQNDAPRGWQHREFGKSRGALGVADGAVPDDTTVFDGDVPGVAKLDVALLEALRRAAVAAADAGITFFVDSGWRSSEYQAQLLREAIAKYGSQAQAARWVASPKTSAHVSGNAVDIGRSDAVAWLSAHGVSYGLCQIYDNEPWHFELRPEAVSQGCPPKYADPTQDPRMQH